MHTTTTVEDERGLVRALQAGDDDAFETLVRMYGGRMLSVAKRFVRNEEDARDVVQSAYLSAFRSVARFEGHCQVSTWLHRIVVNEALMRLRTRRRRPETSIDELLPTFLEDGHHVEEFADWTVRADDMIEKREASQILRACIAQLPDNYRQVLILRDIEEVSTEEAARLLSMTSTAVKVRLHRARQALSTLMRRAFADRYELAPSL
jgi:RNA polymerase sigma-70 factor (ECF subfamily)